MIIFTQTEPQLGVVVAESHSEMMYISGCVNSLSCYLEPVSFGSNMNAQNYTWNDFLKLSATSFVVWSRKRKKRDELSWRWNCNFQSPNLTLTQGYKKRTVNDWSSSDCFRWDPLIRTELWGRNVCRKVLVELLPGVLPLLLLLLRCIHSFQLDGGLMWVLKSGKFN